MPSPDTTSPKTDAMDDAEDKTAPETAVDTTDDGIPLFANGRALTQMEIDILREARDRRAATVATSDLPPEKGGARRQTDPARYSDWEIGGRAIDFS